MKALIFAAGLGTRLRPLTDRLPKALVPVAGKPLLEHILLKLKRAGFEDVVINVHHFPELIRDFLRQNGDFGMRIALSDESAQLLETGGGILHAEALLADGEPFLVHNVDILSNLDLRNFYEAARNDKEALATLAVSHRTSTRQLLFADERLVGWHNLTTGAYRPEGVEATLDGRADAMAFSGMHVISPAIFDEMRKQGLQGGFPIMDVYLNALAHAKIKAYQPQDLRLMDVGKIATLAEAEDFVKTL